MAHREHVPTLSFLTADQFLAFRECITNGDSIQIESFTVKTIKATKRTLKARFRVESLFEGHKGITFGPDTDLGQVISKVRSLLADKAQDRFGFFTDGASTSYKKVSNG
jgi:hypothetical protein